MIFLAIDTALQATSVALVELTTGNKTKLLTSFYLDGALTHSETTLPLLEQALAAARLSLADIDFFVAVTGPGSFTGLRIGVTLVKTLAYTQKKPCIVVRSLDCLTYSVSSISEIAVPVAEAELHKATPLEAANSETTNTANSVAFTTPAASTAAGQAKGTADNYLLCPLLDARNERVFTKVTYRGEDLIAAQACAFADLLSQIQALNLALADQQQVPTLLFLQTQELTWLHNYSAALANLPWQVKLKTLNLQAAAAAQLAAERYLHFGSKILLAAEDVEVEYFALSQAERMRQA